jgi:carbamoyltransferase
LAFYLGLFGYGPNSAAALIEDGQLVAFAEEERFNRIKTAPNSLPLAALDYCLSEPGIGIDQVAAIGFGWDCPDYVKTMPAFYANLHETYEDGDAEYNELVKQSHLSTFHPERIRWDLVRGLAARGHHLDPVKIDFLPHHQCHAASTFYVSGFDEATILTIDGSGEEKTTFIWHGKGADITEVRRVDLPHSLGGFFAMFTEFLGFRPYQDEGKLMGLAAFAEPGEDARANVGQVLRFDPETGEFLLDPTMRYMDRRTLGRNFTDRFVDIFGPPRRSHEPLEDHHRDLAAAVQEQLEQIAAALVRDGIRQTDAAKVCVAGGVGMNCKMNGLIGRLPEVEDIYVQPAAADNGIALGAALILARRDGVETFEPMRHAYWGPEYSEDQCEAALIEAKLDYRRVENVAEITAELLADGLIIGWFQGRMEVGARALGNRSILANPVLKDARDLVNAEVKHRETWRPFCPSILAETYNRYFGDDVPDSPFMTLAFPMLPEFHDALPSVVHVDGTARPQSVRKDVNPVYHALIEALGVRTGHPVVLNTSFNIQGEPIVCTPRDALRCFGGTGIDVLVLDNFVTAKPSVILPKEN